MLLLTFFFFSFSGDIKIVLESSASYLYHLISHLGITQSWSPALSHWLLSTIPARFCCSSCLPKLHLLLPLSSWQLKGSSGEIPLSQVLSPFLLYWRNSWHKKKRGEKRILVIWVPLHAHLPFPVLHSTFHFLFKVWVWIISHFLLFQVCSTQTAMLKRSVKALLLIHFYLTTHVLEEIFFFPLQIGKKKLSCVPLKWKTVWLSATCRLWMCLFVSTSENKRLH